MDKLEIAQKCYMGFLKEFLNYFENQEFTKAIDLLKEEINIVTKNQLHEFDIAILEALNELKELVLCNGNVIEFVKKEIDTISKDLSISTT